jgi:hypothetical protein
MRTIFDLCTESSGVAFVPVLKNILSNYETTQGNSLSQLL